MASQDSISGRSSRSRAFSFRKLLPFLFSKKVDVDSLSERDRNLLYLDGVKDEIFSREGKFDTEKAEGQLQSIEREISRHENGLRKYDSTGSNMLHKDIIKLLGRWIEKEDDDIRNKEENPQQPKKSIAPPKLDAEKDILGELKDVLGWRKAIAKYAALQFLLKREREKLVSAQKRSRVFPFSLFSSSSNEIQNRIDDLDELTSNSVEEKLGDTYKEYSDKKSWWSKIISIFFLGRAKKDPTQKKYNGSQERFKEIEKNIEKGDDVLDRLSREIQKEKFLSTLEIGDFLEVIVDASAGAMLHVDEDSLDESKVTSEIKSLIESEKTHRKDKESEFENATSKKSFILKELRPPKKEDKENYNPFNIPTILKLSEKLEENIKKFGEHIRDYEVLRHVLQFEQSLKKVKDPNAETAWEQQIGEIQTRIDDLDRMIKLYEKYLHVIKSDIQLVDLLETETLSTAFGAENVNQCKTDEAVYDDLDLQIKIPNAPSTSVKMKTPNKEELIEELRREFEIQKKQPEKEKEQMFKAITKKKESEIDKNANDTENENNIIGKKMNKLNENIKKLDAEILKYTSLLRIATTDKELQEVRGKQELETEQKRIDRIEVKIERREKIYLHHKKHLKNLAKIRTRDLFKNTREVKKHVMVKRRVSRKSLGRLSSAFSMSGSNALQNIKTKTVIETPLDHLYYNTKVLLGEGNMSHKVGDLNYEAVENHIKNIEADVKWFEKGKERLSEKYSSLEKATELPEASRRNQLTRKLNKEVDECDKTIADLDTLLQMIKTDSQLENVRELVENPRSEKIIHRENEIKDIKALKKRLIAVRKANAETLNKARLIPTLPPKEKKSVVGKMRRKTSIFGNNDPLGNIEIDIKEAEKVDIRNIIKVSGKSVPTAAFAAKQDEKRSVDISSGASSRKKKKAKKSKFKKLFGLGR